MSTTRPLPSVRRGPIPGMVGYAPDSREAAPASEPEPAAPGTFQDESDPSVGAEDSLRSVDYSVTRLVNFRLPVDVHDRFRALVRDAEERHPRLRKASLTELVIALLEEGPQTADEVAELIRRKRIAENEEG